MFHQRLARDDQPGGVGAGVAGHPLQPAGGVHQALHLLVRLVDRAQVRVLLQRPFDRHAQGGRYQAGDPVGVAVAHAQGAADVADGGLCAQRPEGDDLGDVIGAVLLGGVV